MICDQCETVAHCMKHGCVPKQLMPIKDEALRMALEVMRNQGDVGVDEWIAAEAAIKQSLAAPVQEPVAWKHDCAALLQNDVELWVDWCPHCGKPRATPTAAQRKPLTNEQIFAIGKALGARCRLGGNPNIDLDYARAIEQAHGIKERSQ